MSPPTAAHPRSRGPLRPGASLLGSSLLLGLTLGLTLGPRPPSAARGGLSIAAAPALARNEAQAADCPPPRIHLPYLVRGRGIAFEPGAPRPPTPALSGPCPSATTSPTPTASPSPTRPAGSSTPATPGPSATPGASPSPSPSPTSNVGPSPSPSATSGISPSPSATWTLGPTPSPFPTASASPSPTPSPSPTRPAGVFGIQAFESDVGPIASGLIDEAGATWVRTRALWAGIEPRDARPPAYDWGMTDSMIGGIAGRGLRPVVVVYTKPAWAASQSCGPVDRVPLARYAAFLQALVERYDGDGIADAPGSPVARHWEIGNEPDLMDSQRGAEDYGSCFGDVPEAYAEQLRVAWQAVKAADPGATVIFGSVAYDRFHDQPAFDPPGPFRHDFVRQVLASLIAAHGAEPGFPFFDWLGFHNYNDFRNNWDGPDGAEPEIVGKAARLRAEQLRSPGAFDLSARPLFASEVGLPSGPSDPYTERSEALQASYVGQVMLRAMAADLEGAVWYTLTDSIPDATNPRCDDLYSWLVHGLMRSRWVAEALRGCPESPLPGYTAAADFEAKPALRAFAVAAQLLSGAQIDRRLSAAETGNPSIEAWRLRLADGRSALVAFTDTGERIGRRGFAPIQADLSLDASLLPGWSGRLRLTDHLGESRLETGDRVNLRLGPAPLYVEILP